jgi:hypothetical protein
MCAALLVSLGPLVGGWVKHLHDLRQLPPTRVGTVSGSYDALARCAATELQAAPASTFATGLGNLLYQVGERSAERSVTVTGMITPMGNTIPIVDFVFDGRNEGVTRIESRRSSAQGPRLERQAWPYIERCAGRPVRLEPDLNAKP